MFEIIKDTSTYMLVRKNDRDTGWGNCSNESLIERFGINGIIERVKWDDVVYLASDLHIYIKPAMPSDEEFKKINDGIHEEMVKMEKEEMRKNSRILRFIASKSQDFFTNLLEIIQESRVHGVFEIVISTTGDYQEEFYSHINGIWVDQYRNGGMTGDEFAGYIYIQLKKNRWLKMNYSM